VVYRVRICRHGVNSRLGYPQKKVVGSRVNRTKKTDYNESEKGLLPQIDRKQANRPIKQTEKPSPITEKRTRKTGLNRPIAKTVIEDITSLDPGPVVKSEVMAEYKIGKELVNEIFKKLVSDGVLTITSKGRYTR
jgi:hypothetical protein